MFRFLSKCNLRKTHKTRPTVKCRIELTGTISICFCSSISDLAECVGSNVPSAMSRNSCPIGSSFSTDSESSDHSLTISPLECAPFCSGDW